MELDDVRKLVNELFTKYKIKNWNFEFFTKKKSLGMCDFNTKTLYIGLQYCAVNDEKRIRNTLLHEVAHILVGLKNGHNFIWRRKCVEIGGDGERLTQTDKIVATYKHQYKCPACNTIYPTHKRLSTIGFCSKCWKEKQKVKVIKVGNKRSK